MTTIFVCTSCGSKEGKVSAGNGKALFEALHQTLAGDPDLRVQAVGCLSNCDRGISVAITGQNKFGWVSADQTDTAASVDAIIHTARAHATTDDGFIAKIDRLQPVIARVPYVGYENS